MLAAVVLLVDFYGASNFKNPTVACQEILQPRVALTRNQLTQLLAVPERSKKEKVRAIVKEPYCKLPSLEVRAGVVSDREVYPLEFDPQTWLIILYEGDEYAGYRLNAR